MNNDELMKFLDENPTYKDEIIKKAKNQNLQNQVQNIISDIDTSDNEYLKNIIPQEKIQEQMSQTHQQSLNQDELNAIIDSDPMASAYINNSPKIKQKLEENTKNNSQVIDNRMDKNLSDDELFNQLPTNWEKEQKHKMVKYYKEYGKKYNNINEYANETKNDFTSMLGKSRELMYDKELYSHYKLSDKPRVISAYVDYLNDKTLKREQTLDFNTFIFDRVSRLKNDIQGEIEQDNANLDVINDKATEQLMAMFSNDKARVVQEQELQKMAGLVNKWDKFGYDLSFNKNGDIIVTDRVLGLSHNIGDGKSIFKSIWASKGEIVTAVGAGLASGAAMGAYGGAVGAGIGAGVGAGRVLLAELLGSAVGAFVGSGYDYVKAANEMGYDIDYSKMLDKMKDSAIFDLGGGLVITGALKGGKALISKMASKPMQVANHLGEKLPDDFIRENTNWLKNRVFNEGFDNAQVYAKEFLGLNDARYDEVIAFNNAYSGIFDLSNEKFAERQVSLGLYNNITSKVNKVSDAVATSKLMKAAARGSYQGSDIVVAAMNNNPQIAKEIAQELGVSASSYKNLITNGVINDETKSETLARIINDKKVQITKNYNKAVNKISDLSNASDVESYLPELENILKKVIEKNKFGLANDELALIQGTINRISDEPMKFADLVGVRKAVQDNYAKAMKGKLGDTYHKIIGVLDDEIESHLSKLQKLINKDDVSLLDSFKSARTDYHNYLETKNIFDKGTLEYFDWIKSKNNTKKYVEVVKDFAEKSVRVNELDPNKTSVLDNMMTRLGLNDEEIAYIEQAMIDEVLRKHTTNIETLKYDYYDYTTIFNELKQMKFKSKEAQDTIKIAEDFANILANDFKIAKALQDSRVVSRPLTVAEHITGKLKQMGVVGMINMLYKYLPGNIGKSEAFKYHLFKAIKYSKNLEELKGQMKRDFEFLDKNNLQHAEVYKEFINDLDTYTKAIKEASKKGNIKSVKENAKSFNVMNADELAKYFNISKKVAYDLTNTRQKLDDFITHDLANENYLIQRSYKDDGLNGINKQSREVSEDLQRATNTDKPREVADNIVDNERVDSLSRRADVSDEKGVMDDTRNSERELPANNEKSNIQGQDTRIYDNERTKTQTDINRPREPERIRPEPRRDNADVKISDVKLVKKETIEHLANKKAKQKKAKDLSDEKVLNESIKEAKEQRTLSEVAKNYAGTIDKANINTNIQSLKLLKELESTGRIANEEEQRLLASFSGFGKDAQKVFSEDSKYLKELKEFLSDDEIESLKRATLDAYFTPTSIVNNMYEIMKKQGLSKGDLILEPSVGLGAFVRGKSEYSFNLVELNPLIARFTKQLYPSSKLINDDYIKTTAKANFILANPPYGNIKTFYKNEELNIHNAFVKKMIDDLNENGVLGMVITHSFIDNMDNAMKEFLYKNADFITMLKVPNKAFKDTDVNTDIIFLRKGTGQNIDVMLDNFYEKYPQNLLGASKSQKTNQYGKLEDYFSGGALDKAHAKDNIKINLDDIKIYEYEKNPIINKELDQPLLKAREYYNKNADEVRQGEVYVKDNKVYFNDSEININELDKTRKAAYKKFIELYPQIKSLRTTLNSLREAELSDAKLDTINLLRTKLNHDYDVLAKKLKNDNIFNSHALRYGLENDAYAYELKALISYDEKTKKYYKNDIFHKRVFNPIRAESKPETIVDAFYYNQNKNYAFYSKSLSELLDNRFSIEEIEKELLDKELILKNYNGELIDTNELLSGDLLEKIADFKNAKTLDEYQLKTLEKLENALPERIKIDDISFSMSSNIIKEKYIKDFFSDTYKANIKEIIKEPNTSKIDVVFSELGEHKLYVDDLYKTYDISDFADIILNNKQVIAQKYINKELVVSDKGTQALKGIISDIKLKFDKFVRSNYATEIEESVYKLNAKINKSYENSHISIQGMNADISLYEHQKNAVARVLDNKATFIAHEMGLGKTMSIASSVMKLKEVGKANRSMIITPKAVVGQFANEFKFLYPNAKILMIDKFDVDNRLKTLNMMKYNDFDVCIISHDNFKNIKINAEYEANFIKNEIQELKDTIERIKKRDNENINIKNLQLRMENAEAKLKNRLEIANNEKDNVFFDDLGIDALFVDEAHKFKNMSFYSSFKNLKGLGAEKASDIAYDMYIKTSFLRDNDKHIVFATGTPLSNSITELYSYMRMLKPELLGEYNIHSLDDFVNAFAKVETVLEPNAKNELVEATRITDIVNIKTLKNMLFNVMDYMSNKELKEFWQERARNGDLIAHDKLRRLAPNLEHIEVAIEPTAEHKARNRLYASFYDDLQNGKDHALAGLEHYKKMYEENRLNEKYEGRFSSDKIYTRKLAANGELNAARMNDSIDIRLNGGTLDDENSKINTAVKNIINTAKEWQKDKGTQIVFLDKSNAMQDEIREKLIKSGEFKESEIINIRDFDKITNENKRNEEIAKTLQKMQNGEIRVLIGSRQKLGAGVNVQKRIVALHNIDAPWNAADYMQALGRAERQGNELNQIYDNFSVKSYNYVLKESFDAKVYDILKHKQNISRTFFAKDSNLNSAENFAGDIPFETMSNLANGNELATKMHELMKQRATLLENKAAIEAANTNNEQMLSKNQALFSKANKTQKLIKSLDIKEDENVIIGGKEYPKNSDTNKLIKEHLRTNQHSHDFLLSYDGVHINYQRLGFNKYELFIYDKIDGVDTRFDLVKEFSLDDNTNILQRLKNSFAKFDDIIKEQGEIKYNALKKINEAKEYKVQVFNDDEKIIKLNNEIAELKQEIERQVKAAKEQAFNEPIKEEIKQEIKPIANEIKNLSDDEFLAKIEQDLRADESLKRSLNSDDLQNSKLAFNEKLEKVLIDNFAENEQYYSKLLNDESLKKQVADELFNKIKKQESKALNDDLINKSKDELVNIAKEDNLSVKELNVMLLKKQIAEFRANPLSNRIDIKKSLDNEDKKEILKTLAKFGNANLDDEFLDSVIKNKNTREFIDRLELNKELKQVVTNSYSVDTIVKELTRLIDVVLFKNGDGAYINAALLPKLSDDELIKYAANKKLIPAIKISENKKDEVMLKFLDFVKADKLKGAKAKLKNMRSLEKLNWYDDKVTKRIDEFVYDYVDRTMFNDYHLEADYLYEIKQNLKDLLFNNRINIDIFADSKVSDFM